MVIVTGAGQGLGRATALGFGRRGAKVALVDNNEATLNDVVMEMPNHGVDSIPILADIAAAGAASAIVEKTTDFFGRLDVLVNNAAVSSVEPFLIDLEAYIHSRTVDIPLRRRTTPEEVAEAIIWLATGPASYVTANRLNISGGLELD